MTSSDHTATRSGLVHASIGCFDAQPSMDGRRLGELLGISKRKVAPKPFPLTRVVVRARIVGDCAVTELEEHYENPSRTLLDVVHTIPLPANGAVTAFELRAGGRCVRGTCKRRADAQADFESAKVRGKTAAILESERDDLHTISLANVPRGASVVVRMTIVERLRVDDGRFEYRFPTTISEKYVPGAGRSHGGSGKSEDTDRAPDASRLTPPIRLEGGTELDLEIELPAESTDISASIPLCRVNPGAASMVLRPTATSTCNRDIVVRTWTRIEQPVARAYSDGSRTLVVVDPPASRKPELEAPREAVFVLDRSGSMEGLRLEAAKRALTAALRALSPKDTFEIIAFDNRIVTFSSAPATVTSTNLARALDFIDKIRAEGGTEALPALSLACATRVAQGRVRTVLFLTDGDIANDDEILSLSRSLDPATRLFAIGIGAAPSATLLARLARLCGGTHLFVQDSDDIEAEIRRFESSLAGPMACGLGEVGARRPAGGDLFAGRSTVFFLEGHREHVEIESTDGRFRGRCAVLPSPIALGALWARDRVQTLEDRRISRPTDAALIDDEIVSLGISHQIQTRLTSFVAIDEESQEQGEAVEIVQPVDCVADRAGSMDSVMFCCSVQPPASIREEFADQIDGLAAPAPRSKLPGVGRVLSSHSAEALGSKSPREMRSAALRFRLHSASCIEAMPAEQWNAPETWRIDRAAAIFLALVFMKTSEHDPRVCAVLSALRKILGASADGFIALVRQHVAASRHVEAFEAAYLVARLQRPHHLLDMIEPERP